MKFVRKTTAVLLAAVLGLLLCMAAFAAEDSAVWLKVDQGTDTTVEITAAAAVTDGVLTVTYDSSVLTYQSITVSGSYVANHAVNSQTPGVLLISWVAPGAYAADGAHVLFTLEFSGVEQANTVSLTGTVQNAEGNALALGQAQVTQKPQEESTEATENTGGDSANTGDRSRLVSAACVGLLAACGIAAVVKKGWGAR